MWRSVPPTGLISRRIWLDATLADWPHKLLRKPVRTPNCWATCVGRGHMYGDVGRWSRFHQVVLISSLLPLSWLGMMAVHEAGHVVAAWLTGGKIVRVVLYPLT